MQPTVDAGTDLDKGKTLHTTTDLDCTYSWSGQIANGSLIVLLDEVAQHGLSRSLWLLLLRVLGTVPWGLHGPREGCMTDLQQEDRLHLLLAVLFQYRT